MILRTILILAIILLPGGILFAAIALLVAKVRKRSSQKPRKPTDCG